ncbi:MlaD family protein [Nocardia sp. NPDC051570]|uniref:MlaD family protein n=1 Tax=Nocardia sp. NPDC051570 TaxID=3364324 RepID=UPI00379C1DD2
MTWRTTGLVLITAAALGGCTVRPADLPVPGVARSGPTYRVGIEFTDVLNLPRRARVVVDGVPVGTVEDISAHRFVATVTVALRSQLRLPADTRAGLQQDTLLGDVYVVLTPPADSSGPALRDGGVIPLAHTWAANSPEDMLAGASTVLGGGDLGALQTVITSVDRAFPEGPEQARRFSATLTAALGQVADNTAAVNEAIDGLGIVAHTAAERRELVEQLLRVLPNALTLTAQNLPILLELTRGTDDIAEAAAGVLMRRIERVKSIFAALAPIMAASPELDVWFGHTLAAADGLFGARGEAMSRGSMLSFPVSVQGLSVDDPAGVPGAAGRLAPVTAEKLAELLTNLGVR